MTDTLSPAQTATQTPTGRVRSVPKLVFTDAEAGALEFPSSNSRRFSYFEPARMKATLYEDVTVDVQPDPERYLTQGWVYAFADGKAGYPHDWTALKSSNWHAFLDPNEEWEQTIYRNNAISVASAHKLRFGQDMILYNLELSESIDGFDGEAHKATWASDPIWQPTRENVERITGIRDWAEAFFAATVVFEPLVGELFRSEFVMQVAAPQGDFVTPTLMGAGESDVARDARVSRALFGMLANDEQHGEQNRATMESWIDTWAPYSTAAARALQPIWSQPGEKAVRFEESLEHSRRRFAEVVAELNLNAKELD